MTTEFNSSTAVIEPDYIFESEGELFQDNEASYAIPFDDIPLSESYDEELPEEPIDPILGEFGPNDEPPRPVLPKDSEELPKDSEELPKDSEP